ncbi:MAG TPA: hypothetical protein PLA71_00725 [Saccharofermentans sp.]|nr:hypothetical protein [Saccharofermentans sp.]
MKFLEKCEKLLKNDCDKDMDESIPLSDKDKKIIFNIVDGKGTPRRDADDWKGMASDIRKHLKKIGFKDTMSDKELVAFVDAIAAEME